MKTKLIYFSDQQITRIQKDAKEREISFTEMVRRIIDQHYEFKMTHSVSSDSTFNFFTYNNPAATFSRNPDSTLVYSNASWTFNCTDAS